VDEVTVWEKTKCREIDVTLEGANERLENAIGVPEY
jgi:hypothetical protein